MQTEQKFFDKYTPNYKALKAYGFEEKNGNFFLRKEFIDNQFSAEIHISQSNDIEGKVFDIENNEEYFPIKFENAAGGFVGNVRNEYTKLLTDIRDKCFTKNYFLTRQANRLTEYIIQTYRDEPVFMWEKSPEYGVFKNPQSGKWYGIIMNIPHCKLGEKSNNIVEIINLKIDKDKIQKLLLRDGYYPAWHMNKKMWISIILDETLSDEEIINHIEESYSYTIKASKQANKNKIYLRISLV